MAKLPSTRFPFISLGKALNRAEKAFHADKGGKGLSMPVAFSAWGYSDKSSGGFQTVGALRGYGLLLGDGPNVRLTDKARHYFQTELDEDRRKLAAEFASTPALFAHLLDHWGYETVDDAVARTYLKTVIGLNDQSARAALGIYKDNLSFAWIKGSGKVPDEVADGVSTNTNSLGEGDAMQQQQQVQMPLRQQGGLAPNPAEGPGLNVVRGTKGYVIHLTGSVMTKAHADEVITLLTALRATLPEGESGAPNGAQ